MAPPKMKNRAPIGLAAQIWRFAVRTAHRTARSFRENLLLDSIVLLVVTIAMALFAAFLSLSVNLARVVGHLSDEIRVTAYLDSRIDGAAEKEALTQALALPGAGTVRFVSREEGLAMLQRHLARWSGLLEGLEHNPLPAALEVQPTPAARASEADLTSLVEALGRIPGVEEVDWGRRWAARLSFLVEASRVTALGIGATLFLALLILVSNTLKLALLARREEIAILRVVGATEPFIHGPLFLEGILTGMAGGALALGLIGVGRAALAGLDLGAWLPLLVGGVDLDLLAWPVVWGTLAAGTALGLLASGLALSRYAGRP